VSLAEAGGGEVIFSVMGPGTKVRAHCGTTNLRLTAHLGLIVPPSSSGGHDGDDDPVHPEANCRIRVADEWHTWKEGHVLVFDDSFEHEVENSTSSIRAVLLFRFWHPDVSLRERQTALDEALEAIRWEEMRRYNPPVPFADEMSSLSASTRPRYRSVQRRATEESKCSRCRSTGYQSLRVVSARSSYLVATEVDSDCENYCFVCACGEEI